MQLNERFASLPYPLTLGHASKGAQMRFGRLHPLSHATERLMVSRMTVVLLRPISLAIWTGVHLSWRRKSMRLLSPIVICFAMSAFLSLCLPPSPVRTRGRREGVTAQDTEQSDFAKANAPSFPGEG